MRSIQKVRTLREGEGDSPKVHENVLGEGDSQCLAQYHSCQLSRILRETHAFWVGIARGKCIFVRGDPDKIKKYDWKLKISRTFKS